MAIELEAVLLGKSTPEAKGKATRSNLWIRDV